MRTTFWSCSAMQRATSSAVARFSVTPTTSSPSDVWSTSRWVKSWSVEASIRSKIQCSFSIRTRAGTSVKGPICCPTRSARDVNDARSREGRQIRCRSGIRSFRFGSTPARKARAMWVPSLKSEDFNRRSVRALLKNATKRGLKPTVHDLAALAQCAEHPRPLRTSRPNHTVQKQER